MKTQKNIEARTRVSVIRTNKYLYVQALQSGKVLAMSSDKATKETKAKTPADLGKQFAESLQKQGVKRIYFDKGSHKYHGKIKTLADSMRSQGLEF
jgi:large subunit ribosomal protein L18